MESVFNTAISFSSLFFSVGRHANTLFEMLEENYVEGCSEEEAVKLAVTVLLEIVESGAKSIQVGFLIHLKLVSSHGRIVSRYAHFFIPPSDRHHAQGRPNADGLRKRTRSVSQVN